MVVVVVVVVVVVAGGGGGGRRITRLATAASLQASEVLTICTQHAARAVSVVSSLFAPPPWSSYNACRPRMAVKRLVFPDLG